LVAWWQHYATGDWHQIPRAHWQPDGALEFATYSVSWADMAGSSEPLYLCAIYAARQRPSEQPEQPEQHRRKQREEVIRRVRIAYPPVGDVGNAGVATVRQRISDKMFNPSWDTVNRALRDLRAELRALSQLPKK
jgi:hypothetical protein